MFLQNQFRINELPSVSPALNKVNIIFEVFLTSLKDILLKQNVLVFSICRLSLYFTRIVAFG